MSCQCSQAPGGAGGDAGNGMFWRMDAAGGGEERSSESGLDPSAGGRAARCGGAGKDLDNDHAATAARAWRTMIDGGVRIGGVVHCRRINLRHWSSHQLPGARDVGLAAGARQQPVVADAMKPLWQNVKQEAPEAFLTPQDGDETTIFGVVFR